MIDILDLITDFIPWCLVEYEIDLGKLGKWVCENGRKLFSLLEDDEGEYYELHAEVIL